MNSNGSKWHFPFREKAHLSLSLFLLTPRTFGVNLKNLNEFTFANRLQV